MIEANAGTGKTYTLCRIVERLILEKKIPIERILLLLSQRLLLMN